MAGKSGFPCNPEEWKAQDVYTRLECVMKSSFAEVLKIHTERKVSTRMAANMLW
jgi:glutamate dehydrogenase (NAD(P)+)/glutamate dehydrogenase (NADP+)